MKKIIYIALSLLILVLLIILTIYLNGSRNDKSQLAAVSSEVVTNPNQTKGEEIIMTTFQKSGNFIKIDPLHYASGEVTVTKDGDYYYLNFSKDFSSADGPDLYVYLSSKQNYRNIALGGVDTSKTLNLGLLKSISGAQTYKVSKDDFEKYADSVIMWCKQFGVQFSRADLK